MITNLHHLNYHNHNPLCTYFFKHPINYVSSPSPSNMHENNTLTQPHKHVTSSNCNCSLQRGTHTDEQTDIHAGTHVRTISLPKKACRTHLLKHICINTHVGRRTETDGQTDKHVLARTHKHPQTQTARQTHSHEHTDRQADR